MGKNTSIALGEHFDNYVSEKVKSGGYASVSEVIREGLRKLETEDQKLQLLREKLAIGREQAKNGVIAENLSYESLIAELDARTNNQK